MAKILVVDDSKLMRDFIKDSLTDLSFEVLKASNGDEALKIMDELGTEIDGIFCDCEMPVMDGPTFIRKMRSDARFKNKPVIGMTGEDENKKLLFEAGAQIVLKKPFSLKVLEDAVKIIETFKKAIC